MSAALTVYTSPSCRPCKAAKDRLDDDGIPYELVDLSEAPDAKQRLKDAGLIQTPVFEWRGKLLTIADLPTIRQEAAGG